MKGDMRTQLPEKVEMQIKAGSAYSEYDYAIPEGRWYDEKKQDFSCLDGTNSVSYDCLTGDTTCITTTQIEYQFNTRYFHVVSQTEADSETNVDIAMPEPILDKRRLIVNSQYGPMDYGDHYTLSDDGWTSTINVPAVNLDVNQIIELYVYKEEYKSP